MQTSESVRYTTISGKNDLELYFLTPGYTFHDSYTAVTGSLGESKVLNVSIHYYLRYIFFYLETLKQIFVDSS